MGVGGVSLSSPALRGRPLLLVTLASAALTLCLVPAFLSSPDALIRLRSLSYLDRRLLQGLAEREKHQTEDSEDNMSLDLLGRTVVSLPEFPCFSTNCTGSNIFEQWYVDQMAVRGEEERLDALAHRNSQGGPSPSVGLGETTVTTSSPPQDGPLDGNDFSPEILFNRWFVEDVEIRSKLLTEDLRKQLDRYEAIPGIVAVPKPYRGGKVPSSKAYVQATCAADIVGASAFAAGIGIAVAAAVRDCNYSDIRSPAACSQDIFSVLRTTSTVTQYCSNAATACGGSKNAGCSTYIAGMLMRFTTVAESASRMALVCGHAEPQRYGCGLVLERLSWFLGPLGGDLSGGMRVCLPGHKAAPVRDYGLCVGEILGSAGYIAAAGLEISSVHTACSNAGGDPVVCSFSIFSGLRSLSLSANKATRAAQFCGGKSTRCGQELELMSAGLFLIAQSSSGLATKCAHPANFRANNCVVQVANLVKGLMVSVAQALDAASSCRGDDAANIACGSALSKALAAQAFIVEFIARATISCSRHYLKNKSLYECGREIEFVGQGVDVLATCIGAGVVDCGLIGGPRLIATIDLPWRFFNN